MSAGKYTEINNEIFCLSPSGIVDIMELLIWYGANINSQNSGGNTPLHICCVHGQEAAAIVLLRRGVRRDVLNNSNRSACQVAMISGNKNVAKRIEQHDENEVVKFSDRPSYNPRARPMSQLYQLCVTNKTAKKSAGNPTVSKLKQTETAQSTSESLGVSKFGSLKRSMFRGAVKKGSVDRVRVRAVNNTANAYVVTRNYTPQVKEDLTLTIGDQIQVLFIGKEGFIEGVCNGKQGWFPGIYVELINQNNPPQRKDKSNVYESIKLKRVKIKRSAKGFGFSVRGATCDLENYHPTPVVPSLQYVAQVDKAGAAEKAGLEVGHFILQINSRNVVTTPHNEVVELVRNTKKVLDMTVTRSLPVERTSIPPTEIKKPEVPPRNRPVQKIVTDTIAASESELQGPKLRQLSQPVKDGRRLGYVNPMFLLQGGAEAITPPSTSSHEYATVNKEARGEIRHQVSSTDEEQVYPYGQKYDSVVSQLESKSDTLLTGKHSDTKTEDCANRNSGGGSIEFNYESSSSNADMKTDSKVSDFTIESGYFYNSKGNKVTDEQLGPETAITNSEETENTGCFYQDSEKDNQFDYSGQNYYFDQRFSTASIENNKADSTFDDEGDFTPYERMSPEEEPPYDTLNRNDLYYSVPYEGEDTYDRLHFSEQYFSNMPSDGETLEGDNFDFDQYDNLDREATEYDHLQTEEEFYQLAGNRDSEERLYDMEGEQGFGGDTELEKDNVNVIGGSERQINDTLSQFAKAVLEKSLTLKKRRSQQTESNSASESGSNLSLKNSESDKRQESQTSDLGTDISSTFDTDSTLQQVLLNNFISPTRDFIGPAIPWGEQLEDLKEDEFDYLMHPPTFQDQQANPAKLITNTKHDLCTIGLRDRNERSDSSPNRPSHSSPQDGPLDEYNPKHWKRMLKKVHRETPSKPDETGEFVSRQLATESKSCENIYSSNVTSSLLTSERVTYTLEDEHTIAGRIPSIYNEELSPDYEDQYSYWREQLNTSRSTTKKSISDSELSKLTTAFNVVTLPQEPVTPPKPNYSTFPGDPPSNERTYLEDTSLDPYLDFTPTPLDIPEVSPPFYYPGVPSLPSSQLLMPPPEGFDGLDPEMLPPPPDLERSYNTDSYLPPPPSTLELHTMQEHPTLDDVTPPDEILYRMDLKHSRQFKKPSDWSTDEVGEWLESFGMEMYQSAFIDNDIQGSHLGLLGKEDLSALGITKLGHKMTILKEISKLHI